MAIISIVKGPVISDHTVVVDGRGIQFDLTTFIVDGTFYALQWQDVIGERENLDGTVAVVNDLTPYQAAIDEWTALAAAEDALLPTPLEVAKETKMVEIDEKAQLQLATDLNGFDFWDFFVDLTDRFGNAVLVGSAIDNIITRATALQEADDWFANNLTPTPIIDIIIAETAQTKNDFVTDFRAFRDATNLSLPRIYARRAVYVQQLKAAVDIPGVNAIVVDYS